MKWHPKVGDVVMTLADTIGEIRQIDNGVLTLEYQPQTPGRYKWRAHFNAVKRLYAKNQWYDITHTPRYSYMRPREQDNARSVQDKHSTRH